MADEEEWYRNASQGKAESLVVGIGRENEIWRLGICTRGLVGSAKLAP